MVLIAGWLKRKLDGVGPVNNRPSTDKLHHFVRKNKKKIWHRTYDMWHVTRDTWHITRDMFGGLNILSKFQLPREFSSELYQGPSEEDIC